MTTKFANQYSYFYFKFWESEL